MASVEELCDHIALIDKSKKILDGPTQEIRQQYKSNIFEVEYRGDYQKLVNHLNDSYEILSNKPSETAQKLSVQFVNGSTPNEVW